MIKQPKLITIICLILLSAYSPSQSLVYQKIPTAQRTYSPVAGVQSADDFIGINWNKENYNYQTYGYDNMPYIVITNQEEYDNLKLPYSESVDFNKYVLFSGLFSVRSCKKNPGLGYYYHLPSNRYFLYFFIDKEGIAPSNCKDIDRPITYLIPREFFYNTSVIYFYEYQ